MHYQWIARHIAVIGLFTSELNHREWERSVENKVRKMCDVVFSAWSDSF